MSSAESIQRQTPSAASGPGRVLFVTPLWGRDGGVGAHVKESAAALARAGIDVHVLAARVRSDEQAPGVTVHERPQLLDGHAPVRTRLGPAIDGGAEIVHIHQLDEPALVKALQAEAPIVISAHGFPGCTSGVYYFAPGHECTRAHGPGCVVNLLARGCAHTRYPRTLPAKYRNVTRGLAVLRSADLVISYSSAVDRHLAVNGLTRRTIVPYFPTMTPREGSGHATRRRVVFAGRLVIDKGVDALIEAASSVDGEFVICGEGRREPKLRALAGRVGAEQRIRFRGWVGPDELAQELADASVVAVPSLWPEPFGIVGIEALAAGRPAVGSATGGIGDWLEDGVCGTTVAPGDAGALAQALSDLLDDPERQHTMGLAGRALVAERFSPERHVAKLLEGYAGARASWRGGEA